jgi:hypothetical protein
MAALPTRAGTIAPAGLSELGRSRTQRHGPRTMAQLLSSHSWKVVYLCRSLAMSNVRVLERTAIDDVVAWQLGTCETLRVSKRSGFEPGAQGLALATLAALDPSVSEMLLECDFEEPRSTDDLGSTFFAGAFGFALARRIRRIQFAGQPASAGFKALLSALYRQNDGVLGSGSTRSIICVDPVFPLPPVLAEGAVAPVVDSFPAPSVFTLLLNRIVKDMGFRRLLGSSEESSIVSLVYEALRNSLEHGISVVPSRRARSTRALIVEKVVLQSADLTSRRLSPELKEYLERIAEANEGALGLGVVCLTVADQGDGIQSTLPPKAEEAPGARLARAFEPGESRKPAGVVSRGLGLPKVVSAAHHLQALIRVTSGNLVVGQDFSTGENKYPQLNFKAVRQLPEGFVSGTCLSVFIPEFSFDLDQSSLFRR